MHSIVDVAHAAAVVAAAAAAAVSAAATAVVNAIATSVAVVNANICCFVNAKHLFARISSCTLTPTSQHPLPSSNHTLQLQYFNTT